MREAKRENTRFSLPPMKGKTASQKRRNPAKPVTDLGHSCTVSHIMVTSPQVSWLFSRRERSAHI